MVGRGRDVRVGGVTITGPDMLEVDLEVGLDVVLAQVDVGCFTVHCVEHAPSQPFGQGVYTFTVATEVGQPHGLSMEERTMQSGTGQGDGVGWGQEAESVVLMMVGHVVPEGEGVGCGWGWGG
ncbi:uncharacterized protein RSE6_08999 [Rhynchosporium secalis]|uniref:Uncharacterized protein n=1 Tax=Rhynchosporium secalis TaxID=38038 RepID=A0A1E1MGT8_RHYSE|nr:uncharacterized protein RSE6_08999 [Rhynchosporium secalis]